MTRRTGPSRAHRWFPRLHRWLGIASLFFVLLLSGTGVILNHSAGLSLAQRYIRADWLLNWYGIEAPAPTAAYRAGEHAIALLGGRLYLDERELADRVDGLVGVFASEERLVVATESRVYLVTTKGDLIEQLATAGIFPGTLAAVGSLDGRLIFASAGQLYESDPDLLAIARVAATAADEVVWSKPTTLAPAQVEALGRLYRGRGLSFERLLLDLHSGRVFSRFGAWFMDIVALALIALSLFGFLLWWRRQQARRPRR